LNSNILSIKSNAIFLAAVLVAGTITAVYPSFITGVNAEPYYGMDKDRKSDKKDVSVQSLKCNNINVNVNGLELSFLPQFLSGSDLAAEAAESNTDSSSFAGNGADNSQIKDFRFICINNNNNIVTDNDDNATDNGDNATDGDGPDTVRTILSVSKNIGTCTPTDNSQNAIDACAAIETEILPNLYTLSVIDNTQNPTFVEGSEVPVDVTVNPGDYLVAEIGTSALQTAIANITEEFTVDIFPLFSVTGDCSLAPGGAGGTITEGDSQTCNLVNSFEVREMIE
jgi:hypothetical protein